MTPSKLRLSITLILAFSILGFIDASYLTASHYLERDLPCVITEGCDFVTRSRYSKVANIPVALFGAINYAIIFLFTLRFLENKKSRDFKIALIFIALGFFFSLWLLYVQAAILYAFCIYCLVSAGLVTGLLILGIIINKNIREINGALPPL